ncbi:hypothetical protein [Polaribacter sp. SA4-10]|uniref:hypothetical protein n=1 Tax=Polaribacter sp. SA4-10 TaxID=754397 RepID=UPI0012F8531A|nr:hypothetical protein [Polaribacter sp. SA4-10]
MIKLSIVIGCGYFMYTKLVENEQINIDDFYQNLTKKGVLSIKNILLLAFFTFFNWFLEIIKWKVLASFCLETNKKNAAIQSLASLTASLITPNRIGEYGAKAIYFEKPLRKQIVGLNFVGNFYQMLATLFFGLIGFTYFIIQHKVKIDFHRVLQILIVVLIVISAFFFGAKYFNYKGYSFKKAQNYVHKIPFSLNLKVGGLSFLRFVIFSHQFYFLLLIFNSNISYIDAISAITSVYFIASIIPMLSLFDAVLKGTVAVWVFTFFNIDALAILSITTIMWIYNFVIPAILGSYFVLIFKPNFTK